MRINLKKKNSLHNILPIFVWSQDINFAYDYTLFFQTADVKSDAMPYEKEIHFSLQL